MARYHFRNLRLKKNVNGYFYVNTAKEDSVRALQRTVGSTIGNTQWVHKWTFWGWGVITDSQLHFCCYKCNKKVKQDSVTCDNPKCKLHQKLIICRKQWYLKALFCTTQNTDVNLVFMHMIINALSLVDGKHSTDLFNETLENVFLSLPPLRIT